MIWKKSFVLICVLILGLIFFPDFSPLFHHNTISVIKSIQNNLHNTTPVSHFKNNAQQNPTTIINEPISSTGCKTPLSFKAGTSTYVEITSGKTKRRLIIYVPKTFKNTTHHALIVAFHGYSSGPFAMEKISHFNKVADSNNTIIVYPEGTTSWVGLRGWNTGIHPSIRANDILFVSNMLNDVQSNLCVNPNQIYATGFSNGGSLVAQLACQMSNRIAAFSSVSGAYVTAFKTCLALRPIPIIEFHGTKDTIVPYVGLEEKKEFAALTWVNRWAKKDTCTTQPTIINETKKIIKYTWSGCSSNSSIIHYKIIGEGHSWPHVLFKQTINNHTEEMNTANVIWNFFMKHTLPKNKENRQNYGK